MIDCTLILSRDQEVGSRSFSRGPCRFCESGVSGTSPAAPSSRPRKSVRRTLPPSDNFVEPPTCAPVFENLNLPGFEDVPFPLDQTFGIELEVTCQKWPATRDAWDQLVRPWNRWLKYANKLQSRLNETARLPVHPEPVCNSKNVPPTQWCVCSDASTGWEICSPALSNRQGFAELVTVCNRMRNLVRSSEFFTLNQLTGLHVTFATQFFTDEQIRGLVAMVQRLELGLFPLVTPSRLFPFDGGYDLRRRNKYCRPLRTTINRTDRVGFDYFAAPRRSRHRTVNLTKLSGAVQLGEVRMHHGTLRPDRIIPWVSLWMKILAQAHLQSNCTAGVGEVFPGKNREIPRRQVDQEDLFLLLAKEGIDLGRGLEQILRRRRAKLMRCWERVLPARVASWRRADWGTIPAERRRGPVNAKILRKEERKPSHAAVA